MDIVTNRRFHQGKSIVGGLLKYGNIDWLFKPGPIFLIKLLVVLDCSYYQSLVHNVML